MMLRLETERTISNISRKAGVPEQNMHHYISESPWSGAQLIKMVRSAITSHPHFEKGSVLILDESADDKAGEISAGAGRQYNGRRGKVDLCQVGVFLSLAQDGMQNWIDGELFIPEHWFADDYADLRRRLGIPVDRLFQTKIELGWRMIQRAQAEGVFFDAFACDELYGRSFWLRSQLDEAGIEYYADIPADLRVYLHFPHIGLPQPKRGPKAQTPKVLGQSSMRVDQLRDHPALLWQSLTLRPSERGALTADFARVRVWTVQEDLTITEQWLLIRRDGNKHTYSLSNAPLHTSLLSMAQRKAQRYCMERSNQDAKSELGWDEFQATKFNAWEHHLAFTILAQWFITQTRLDWQADYARDPQLLQHYQTDILPALSVANVRELLRATLPLPQLSPADAAALVVKHLDNRTRSRQSRIRRSSDP
jgi:SRSO17 transposase